MKRVICLFALLSLYLIGKSATVDSLSIATNYLPEAERVIVITPDRAAEKPCPTVYLLNGYGGSHQQWMKIRPDLPDLADQYGVHIVLPHGHNSWYWDSPIDPAMQMESFITQELVRYVDTNYNTLAEPGKRAIAGLSMGGHGAMWLGLRHPDIWKNVGAMSGGVDIRPFPDSWTIKDRLGSLDENSDVWDAHTVINLVPSIEPSQNNIMFDCGTEDFFFSVNKNLHEALLTAGIPHDYIVRPGSHNSDYWRNALLHHLLFFNEKFKD